MMYINQLNDLLSSGVNIGLSGAQQSLGYQTLLLPNQQQVRSSSVSSSISSTSSTSPNQSTTQTQTNNNSQLYAKNLTISNNIYPTSTTAYTTGFATYYPIPFASNPTTTNTNLLSITNNEKYLDSNYLTTKPSSLYLLKSSQTTNSENLNLFLTDSQISTPYLTPTFPDLTTINANLALKATTAFSLVTNNKFLKCKKKFKKPIELRKVLPKNSLMLLHELRPNVEYRFVTQSGPIHRPVFTMCVDINEHKFEGSGKTKKLARMQAAEKAVQFLYEHPELIQKQIKKKDEHLSESNTQETINYENEDNSNSSSDDGVHKKFKPDNETNETTS